MSRAFRDLVLAVVVAAVLAGAAGFFVGERAAVSMHTGIAGPAPNAISVEADGWTYNVPLDVPWTDTTGVWHDAGRPACLSADVTTNVPITFAAVDVTVDGTGWRQVVWVDCRRS